MSSSCVWEEEGRGGGELKATCLFFFWKKLVIEVCCVSWSSPVVEARDPGLVEDDLRVPFLELSILGRGAVVPSPGMGRPILITELSRICSVS